MSQTNSSVRSSIAERGFRRKTSGQMGAPVEKPKNTRSALARLFGYFRQEMVLVIILALAVSFSVIAGVLAPRFQSQAIDHLVSRSFSEVSGVLALMILLYALHGAATLLQGYLSARLSQRIIGRLRGDLFHKIVNLPVSYLDSRSHGDIMSRMTNDAENVSTVISQSLSSLFSGILTLIGTIIVMLSFNVPLTLLTCSSVILSIWLTKIISELMHKYYVMRQTLLGQLNGTVEEKITNTKTVTAYNLQDAVIKDFSKTSDELTKAGIIAEIIAGSMGPLHNMLNNVSFVIVAAFGAWFALRGFISIGVISAFVVYSKQFSRPINELAQLFGQIQTAIAGAERIFGLLDEKPEEDEGYVTLVNAKEENGQLTETTERTGLWAWKHPHTDGSGVTYRKLEGDVVMEEVDFGYVPEKTVLHDITLYARPGQKVAFVGATGAGKTTITNLINRFYDIADGKIRYDGININKIRKPDLRHSLGVVLQEVNLFTGTVMDNIRYGKLDATDEECIAAAKLANAHDFITRLPDGYQTVLSGDGGGLSQGQRQLISIARAAVADPPVMILDEATSSIDTRTEALVQQGMDRLMHGRTVFVIAHRLSTVKNSDVIMVLDHGRIIERGSHDQLIAEKGQYYQLYTGAFELE